MLVIALASPALGGGDILPTEVARASAIVHATAVDRSSCVSDDGTQAWVFVTFDVHEINSIAAVNVDDWDGGCEGGVMYTIPKYRQGSMIDADILVNPSCRFLGDLDYFDFNDTNVLDHKFNMKQTLMHEIGHVAGLDHEYANLDGPSPENPCILYNGDRCVAVEYNDWDGRLATMLPGINAGSVIGDRGFMQRNYEVSEDDRVGLRTLYPASTTGHDVAAASFVMPDDEVRRASVGKRRCMFNTFQDRGRPSPHVDWFARRTAEDPDPNLQWECPTDRSTNPLAALGYLRPVDVQFSMLNLGTFTETWEYLLELVLVSNPRQRYKVVRGTLRHSPSVPVDKTMVLTLDVGPKPVLSGTYDVVLTVDPANRIPEGAKEGNNVAYWNRRVLVQR